MILKSIQKTKHVIVMEDGVILGGLSSSIKELLADYSLTDVSIQYYAYPDEFIKQGSCSQIEKKYGLDIASIEKTVLKEKR